MKSRFWLVVLGFVAGVAVAVLAPRLFDPFLPEGLLPQAPTSEGTVEAKQWQEKSLLVTLVTQEGATLATFRDKVAEIDLLIDVGDRVALGIRRYQPFVEDPSIVKVVKQEQLTPERVAEPVDLTTVEATEEEDVEEPAIETPPAELHEGEAETAGEKATPGTEQDLVQDPDAAPEENGNNIAATSCH